MAESSRRLRPRERDTILQSLRAGVTPHIGLHHIQVGRAEEVNALVEDIDRIANEGIRFTDYYGDQSRIMKCSIKFISKVDSE